MQLPIFLAVLLLASVAVAEPPVAKPPVDKPLIDKPDSSRPDASTARARLADAGASGDAGAAPLVDAAPPSIAPPSIAPPSPPEVAPPEVVPPTDTLADAASEVPPAIDAGAPDAALPTAPVPSAAVPVARPEPTEVATVRLGDASVFNVRGSRAGKNPEQRAREATDALKRALQLEKDPVVRMTIQGDVATITVGQTPIIQVTSEDADLAGDSSLAVHAADVVATIREAVHAERRRSAIAKSVFSFSLVVFFGLIAFYLIRKLGEFEDRAREWLDAKADRDLTIHVRRIEVVRPATVRSSAVLGLSIGKWVGQFGIAYAWLVVVLSMFESTRNYTERLTGFVLGPLSQLMERLATALPLLFVALLATLAVFVLVRFVGLFFASVARGETPLPWLPADLAAPTSVLLRAGIVLAALVFAAPVVTGDPDGALARAGAIILVALGLASTPMLACALLGSAVLYGRRLRIGDFAEIAGRTGRVYAINLLEVRLRDVDHAEVRIPHLFALLHPVRVLGARPRISVNVRIAAGAPQAEVRALLEGVAQKFGRDVRADIVAIDAESVHYEVSAACEALDTKGPLQYAIIDALSAANVALGRATNGGAR